jgi:hypothetical protein
MGAWEQLSEQFFSDPRFGAWVERMTPLVETGSREFWNVVD